MSNGWNESAEAWIKDMGERGDRGREFVLDPALSKLIDAGDYKNALDVGCGEGRMCRMLQRYGIETIGLDPTLALLERAQQLDAQGKYIEGIAENLPFADNHFELVLSCMSLIDIADYRAAIKEMVRVLKPGGDLLIANLTSMNTAAGRLGWQKDENRQLKYYAIDNYMIEHENWEEWRGIKIKNYHRPLSAYLQCLLEHGLQLQYFDEPMPVGADEALTNHYKRMPWYLIMKWQKI